MGGLKLEEADPKGREDDSPGSPKPEFGSSFLDDGSPESPTGLERDDSPESPEQNEEEDEQARRGTRKPAGLVKKSSSSFADLTSREVIVPEPQKVEDSPG